MPVKQHKKAEFYVPNKNWNLKLYVKKDEKGFMSQESYNKVEIATVLQETIEIWPQSESIQQIGQILVQYIARW